MDTLANDAGFLGLTDSLHLDVDDLGTPALTASATVTIQFNQPPVADDVTAKPIRVERGHVEVSDRPGLGIDVDEDRVRRYRRDVPVRQVA